MKSCPLTIASQFAGASSRLTVLLAAAASTASGQRSIGAGPRRAEAHGLCTFALLGRGASAASLEAKLGRQAF